MWPTYFIPSIQQAFYLTTPLYPIEVTENIGSNGSITYGFQWNTPVDSIDSTAQITDGTRRDLLLFGYGGPDSIDSTAQLVDGTRRDLLLFGYGGPDSIDSTAQPTSGVLATVLIIYDNWKLIAYPDESIESTAQITGGTRT
jgi:hypothetical protein